MYNVLSYVIDISQYMDDKRRAAQGANDRLQPPGTNEQKSLPVVMAPLQNPCTDKYEELLVELLALQRENMTASDRSNNQALSSELHDTVVLGVNRVYVDWAFLGCNSHCHECTSQNLQPRTTFLEIHDTL